MRKRENSGPLRTTERNMGLSGRKGSSWIKGSPLGMQTDATARFQCYPEIFQLQNYNSKTKPNSLLPPGPCLPPSHTTCPSITCTIYTIRVRIIWEACVHASAQAPPQTSEARGGGAPSPTFLQAPQVIPVHTKAVGPSSARPPPPPRPLHLHQGHESAGGTLSLHILIVNILPGSSEGRWQAHSNKNKSCLFQGDARAPS